MTPRQRIIVALTGSSGPHYGVRLLEVLRAEDVEVHLILSAAARKTIEYEMGRDPDQVLTLADVVHDERNIAAPVASGTFLTDGMVVAPCSIRTLSAIANSANDNLVVRAADVCLKERRRVVLMLRETPLHAGHIDLMAQATRNGAIIMPPVPAFYALPATLDDVVDQTVARALELLEISVPGIKRWDGKAATAPETNGRGRAVEH